MSKPICGIYKIQNLINNKVYIGQSVNIKSRWHSENNRKCHNRHLKSAFKKYGIENFSYEIIYECDKSILDIAEMTFIRLYCSTFREYGYNITYGGNISNRGLKAWTNGEKTIYDKECPKGFYRGTYAKGKKCWTNGEKIVYADICPDGYKPFVGSNIGKKCWTNGKKNIRAIECPPGFWRGITFTKDCAKNKGMQLFTNGKEQKFCEQCPDGWWQGSCKQAYIKGKKCWTNGLQNIYAKECPEGYWAGMTGHIGGNNKGKKCYTDGIKNCYFNDDDEIPEGFYLGSYKKGKSIGHKS